MEVADALEAELFLDGQLWHGHMAAFRVDQAVNVSTINNETDTYASAHGDISDVVSDSLVASILKLKLGKNVAVSVKNNAEISRFSLIVYAFQEHIKERRVLPLDLGRRSNIAELLLFLVEAERSKSCNSERRKYFFARIDPFTYLGHGLLGLLCLHNMFIKHSDGGSIFHDTDLA